MYIEDRLFSENNPEEVFYSISMTEEEYALFSEFQKEFGFIGSFLSKGKAALSKGAAAMKGRAAAAADGVLHDKLTNKILNSAVKSEKAAAAASAASKAEKFGGMRNVVKAKQAVKGWGQKIKGGARSTGNSFREGFNGVKESIQGFKSDLAEMGRSGREAIQEAGSNMRAQAVAARQGTGRGIQRFGGWLAQ